MLADVFEAEVEFAYGILLDPCGDADPAGFGQCFQTCRDIDPVAKNVALLDDDIADVDANAKFDPIVSSNRRIALGHRTLYRGCTVQCINDAGELDQ